MLVNPWMVIVISCPKCDGLGYTAEHDLNDPHENGCCSNCPIQVPCEECEGTCVNPPYHAEPPTTKG